MKLLATDEARFDSNDHGPLTQAIPHTAAGRKRILPRKFTNFPLSVHVWAAIGKQFKRLVIFPEKQTGDNDGNGFFRVNAKAYVARCLPKIVTHCLTHKLTILQDGAKAHTARSTKCYLARKRVRYFTNWPARSPDLNPIEHLWAWMKKEVGKRPPPSSRDELVLYIREAWDAMPLSTVESHLKNWESAMTRCMESSGR